MSGSFDYKLAKSTSDESRRTPRYDVLVVGGGPAGAATAITLRQLGHSVILVERSSYDAIRTGEVFPPETQVPLTQLGVLPLLTEQIATPSPGTCACWDDSVPREIDHIRSPFGLGWHVDRRRFDQLLAEVARRAGAIVMSSTQLVEFGYTPRDAWNVRMIRDGCPLECNADFLVDASGRKGSPIRRLGGGRLLLDRLVGVVAVVEHAKVRDARMFVEATENGWWYSAQLPNNRLVVAYLSDADLLPRPRSTLAAFLTDQLAKAPLTQSRFGGQLDASSYHLVPANTSRMRRIAGANRIAVGDAATALDPLSGQGVYRALVSGIAGAEAIHRFLDGDHRSIEDFAAEMCDDFDADLGARAAFYREDRRWPNSVFWQRRWLKNGAGARGIISR
jgi:flavin-dependent dehydrogenase